MNEMTGVAPAAAIEAAARATAEEREREMRLFLVVQHGLRFNDEALAAAAARTTWQTLRAAGRTHPDRLAHYDAHVQPKICLRAKNEAALLRAAAETADAGLPFAEVHVTRADPLEAEARAMLGIGPVLRVELPKFVQKLQLFAHDPLPDGEPVADPAVPLADAIWLLVRRDLGLSQGKLAAQAGHACWTAGNIALAVDPQAVERWEEAGCPIGVLWLDDLDAMHEAHAAVSAEGLASAFIVDAGRTELDPRTPTVLGVGLCGPEALPAAVRRLLEESYSAASFSASALKAL